MTQTNGREGRPARRLTPEQRRRILELRRRRRRRKQLAIAAGAALAVVLAVTLALTLGGRRDRTPAPALPAAGDAENLPLADSSAQPATETAGAPGAEPEGEAGGAAETEAAAAPARTPEPTANPNAYVAPGGAFVFDDAYVAAATGADTGPLISADLSNVDPAKADRWPAAKEGYLPVLYSADTTENIIAVTVDDCNQASNLRQIVQCALDNNARLTIFPIGKNLEKESISSVVKWAWESGMEIENHTYTHAGMYHYDDERMGNEMWGQNAQLSKILGVSYQEHFFRPKGGDERNDQRVHAYARQLGMKGIAVWTQSGSSTPVSGLKLTPGAIFLFHTTDTDLERLLEFIPLATRQGFRLVTLNEMFGLPDNETGTYDASAQKPALESFRIVPAELKKTSYIRAAAVVQKRLIELGWLDGEADGVYGQSSFMATGYFQLAADLQADGKAGPATQAVLFSDAAPEANSENLAKVKAKIKK